MKKAIRSVVPALLGSSTVAFAAEGGSAGEMSFLLIFFLAFFALIVVFQMIPGLLLFFSMLRGLFAPSARKSAPAAGGEADKSI